MTTHSPHPDMHTHGLADGCDRCAEHADRPLDSLDDENLDNLVQRVLGKAPPRSLNEGIAMTHVAEALGYARKLSSFLSHGQ